MRKSHWHFIVGLLGCVAVTGCCQSGTSGQSSRLCLLPGFLRSRSVQATIPSASIHAPIIENSGRPALPEIKKPSSPEKLPPRMPPVTELPVAPSLPQRLTPPPRVPVDAPTRSNLPTLIRPSDLPTLPPLVTPPEAQSKPMPVEGPFVVPTDHIVAPPGLPEIHQIGNVDLPPPSAALVKGCDGEAVLLDLVKAKAANNHAVAIVPVGAQQEKKPTPAPVVAPQAVSPRILTGKVQPWRGSWTLRYAEIDAIDEHGGSVILFGDVDLSGLSQGQTVSVQGVLIPAESRHDSARFRVSRIIDKK